MNTGKALSVGLIGLKPFIVTVQTFISPGLPYFSIIGLSDVSLDDTRERIKRAVVNAGAEWPEGRVTVNLSPASLPKGHAVELAIAMSIIDAIGGWDGDMEDVAAIGRVRPDGYIEPVRGVLPMLRYAMDHGVTRAVVPKANLEEARRLTGIGTVGANTIDDVRRAFLIETATPVPPRLRVAAAIAAAGGHGIIIAGTGAHAQNALRDLNRYMPRMNERQQAENASIRSLAGTIGRHLDETLAPTVTANHLDTEARFTGRPDEPGLATQAHNGVLILPELAEYRTRTLLALTEPLETGYITARLGATTTDWPASFLPAATIQPGQWRIVERLHTLTRHMPIRVETDGKNPTGTEADPLELERMAHAARDKARRRYNEYGWTCNQQADRAWLRGLTTTPVLNAIEKHTGKRTEATTDVLRVAWTIADMKGHDRPEHADAAEALELTRNRA